MAEMIGIDTIRVQVTKKMSEQGNMSMIEGEPQTRNSRRLVRFLVLENESEKRFKFKSRRQRTSKVNANWMTVWVTSGSGTDTPERVVDRQQVVRVDEWQKTMDRRFLNSSLSICTQVSTNGFKRRVTVWVESWSGMADGGHAIAGQGSASTRRVG
jgi:hypothetical protein